MLTSNKVYVNIVKVGGERNTSKAKSKRTISEPRQVVFEN